MAPETLQGSELQIADGARGIIPDLRHVVLPLIAEVGAGGEGVGGKQDGHASHDRGQPGSGPAPGQRERADFRECQGQHRGDRIEKAPPACPPLE